MAMVRICESCGTYNPPSESLCTECMANLSGIKPIDPEELEATKMDAASEESIETPEARPVHDERQAERPSSETLFEQDRTLTLVFSESGRTLTVRPGDLLGREGVGKSGFADHLTVSRKHARIMCDGGRWTIEDLRSKNGTWVNGKRLEEGKPCPIGRGDILSLSRSCEMSVKD